MLDDNILAIFQDSQNRLWVACFFNGIVKFDKTNGKHIYYTRQNTGLPLESVHLFEEDSQGNILIGSDEGFFVFDPRTESFKFYNDNLEKGKRLSSNGVFSLAIKNDETVWIGTTFGLNRFDRSSETFTHYFVEDGLPSNMIAGLIFDQRGYLWISTDKGLARMDTEAKKFRTYSIGDGLQGNQFYNRSHYITRNGELLFGGTNGFNLFHPDSLRENREKPSVVLTDLKIMNKKALIGPDKPIKQHITVADRIDLSYRQSVVSIGFAALSYDAPSQNQYAYMLEGFDQSWVYSGNRREVTYTNLPAGKYKFQVIASNKDDIWNTHGTSIDIVVHPPYWNTALFRIAMIILLIGISAAVPLLRIRGINKHNRELERRVKERTANLSAANSEIKALAYSISHDLRGPLRGINGYARIIEEDLGDNITKDIRDHLTKIQSASSRMSQLIDDLLNLSRILRVDLLTDSVNLSKIAEEIRESFQLTEPDRKVNFHIEPNLIVNGDKKLLRSAMENLIGNAWKFTRTKAVGEIEFGFASDPINAFYVRDNGVGFDMNFSNKLFRPFHRLHRDDEFEGTGIGLANVKRIIRRHNGNIWAESNVDQGATFYFQLDQSSMLIN